MKGVLFDIEKEIEDEKFVFKFITFAGDLSKRSSNFEFRPGDLVSQQQ